MSCLRNILRQTLTIFNYGGRAISSGDAVFIKAHTGSMLDVEGVNVQARWQAWGDWQVAVFFLFTQVHLQVRGR